MADAEDAGTGRRVDLAAAIEIAFNYVTALQERMRATVYALEETEYEALRRTYGITISLIRKNAPRKSTTLPSTILPYQQSQPDPNYIFRKVEVREDDGVVVRMVDAGP